MQLTHLGTVLNLAITENATIAVTYDAEVRTYANEQSKFRTREKETIDLLKEEDQRIKREVPPANVDLPQPSHRAMRT